LSTSKGREDKLYRKDLIMDSVYASVRNKRKSERKDWLNIKELSFRPKTYNWGKTA